MKLKYLGEKAYKSTDPEGLKAIDVRKKGVVIEVSQGKGDQLLKDFPKLWEKAPDDAVVTPGAVGSARPDVMGEPRPKKGAAVEVTVNVAELAEVKAKLAALAEEHEVVVKSAEVSAEELKKAREALVAADDKIAELELEVEELKKKHKK